jgi:hypothetical protein
VKGVSGVPLELVGPGSAEKAAFQNFQIPNFYWTADIRRWPSSTAITLYGAFELPEEIINAPIFTQVTRPQLCHVRNLRRIGVLTARHPVVFAVVEAVQGERSWWFGPFLHGFLFVFVGCVWMEFGSVTACMTVCQDLLRASKLINNGSGNEQCERYGHLKDMWAVWLSMAGKPLQSGEKNIRGSVHGDIHIHRVANVPVHI